MSRFTDALCIALVVLPIVAGAQSRFPNVGRAATPATRTNVPLTRQVRPLIGSVLPEMSPNLTAHPPRTNTQPLPSKGDADDGVEFAVRRDDSQAVDPLPSAAAAQSMRRM